MQHVFISNAKPVTILQQMIVEAREIQEDEAYRKDRRGSNAGEPVSAVCCLFERRTCFRTFFPSLECQEMM